jgi:hypothetical protein
MARAFWIVAAGLLLIALPRFANEQLNRPGIIRGLALHHLFATFVLVTLLLGIAVVALGVVQVARAAARALR